MTEHEDLGKSPKMPMKHARPRYNDGSAECY